MKTELTKKQIPLKTEIVKKLEAITKNIISNNILFKNNGKNLTVIFYNCCSEKYFKATIKHGCLISNIREYK